MSNIYIFVLLAIVAGAILPTQVTINSRLASAIGNPMMSAFISFLVGTVALLSFILITGVPLSSIARIKNAPPVALTGGLLGAFFVAVSIIILPRLGVAMTVSLIIAGQMLMSIMIDHFGLLGLPVREISLPRLAGVLMIVFGVVLIRKY